MVINSTNINKPDTSHLNSLYTKKTTAYTDINPGP